ncbi:magnesium transporter [Streptomyces sp. NBC_00873]|uniref:magnesium transporter n=1 Tax=unclassified Streptomyces TaxID=2593676 RepID=UPI00386B1E6C|nr:magnesium transporter [Streptomyces sp. NBC_00873]WTA47468.1 magnesium transporter [Streptomyces sp. NBC_00842]
MRFFTALRTHAAVLALPVTGFFFAYVFFTTKGRMSHFTSLPWPAEAASFAIHAPVPLAAAAAAGLAAVEATRLRTLGVWEMGPARSALRVAVQPILVVVLTLATLIAGITAGALWIVGVAPDVYVLQLFGMVVVLLAAHAAIGFHLGRRLHALYSAPLVSIAVFIAISFPLGTSSWWAHHVTGAVGQVNFGEAYTLSMTIAAVLPTVCLALALIVAIGPRRIRVGAVAVSLVIAGSGLLGAYGITREWTSFAPAAKGLAPIACEGGVPEVCMPAAGSGDLEDLQTALSGMTAKLQAKGIIAEIPTRVTDITVSSIRQPDTVGKKWTLDLAAGSSDGIAWEGVAIAVVGMPCKTPDWNTMHYSTLWTARTMGVADDYLAWLSRESQSFRTGDGKEQLLAETDRVNGLPLNEQKTWYVEQLRLSCQGGLSG